MVELVRKQMPAQLMQNFVRRMHAGGFYSRDLQVEFPNHSDHKKFDPAVYKGMGLIMKGWYKLKRLFNNDELAGLRCPDGYYIFNRNIAGEKSNFFVLAKFDYNKGVEVMFTNPLDPDKGGSKLKKEEIVVYRYSGFKTAKGLDKWADEIISVIKKTAENKPEDKYYAHMHGHWGYSRDKLLMDLGQDDGRSHEIDVIMNMVLWHVDFDATGPHNHHFKPLYEDVKLLEDAVGLVNVPACEVTMPIHLYDNFSVEAFVKSINENRKELGIPKNETIHVPHKIYGRYVLPQVQKLARKYMPFVKKYNSSLSAGQLPMPELVPEVNGPHINLYAMNEKIMRDIQRLYLKNRVLDYPPLAPILEMEHFMSEAAAKYWNGVAFMMAHPACSRALPAVGILNRISRGDISESRSQDVIQRHVQAVASFNPSLSRTEQLLFIPYSVGKLNEIRLAKGEAVYEEEFRMARDIYLAGRYFGELLPKMDSKLHIGTVPTLNTVNMAWAEDQKERHQTATVYDADTHYYVPVRIGRKYIGPLGFGRTAFIGKMEMSAQAFIAALHDARNGKKEIFAEVFWDKNNLDLVPDIVAARKGNTLWESMLEAWGYVKVYGIHGVPQLVTDIFKSIRSERPNSLQAFMHAAMRINR